VLSYGQRIEKEVQIHITVMNLCKITHRFSSFRFTLQVPVSDL
jgi:hypothetical protein